MNNRVNPCKYLRKTFNIKFKLISLLFLHIQVFSQATKDSTLYFKEVELKASPLAQSVFTSPSAVSFIHQKDIHQTDGVMLTPLLNAVAGIQMQQGNWNTNRISIRGQGARSQFSTNRIKLYLNEIPITSAEGESILDDIDLSHMHSIEIIKGPNSTAFGAGTGGVIRIETHEKKDNKSIEMASTAGGFGLTRFTISGNVAYNKWRHKVSMTHQTIDGFRQNSAYERWQLYGQSSYQINDKQNLDFLVLLTDMKAFIPSTISRQDFEANPQLAAANWRAAQGYEAYQRGILGITHTWKTDNLWTFKNSVFTQIRKSDEPRPFDIIDDLLDIYGVRSIALKQIKTTKFPVKFSFGFEGMMENYKLTLFRNLYQDFPGQGSIRGDSFAENAQKRHYMHLFSEVQWRLHSWQLELGIAYNATQYTIQKAENENFAFDAVFLPRMAVSKFFGNKHHVYGSLSSGFAVPTLSESLTVNGNFNTTLQPEQGFNYELGYKWRSSNQNWQSTLTLYRMPVHHLLVARRIAEDQFEGRNAGRSLHQGIEWENQCSIHLNEKQKIQLFSSLTYNDFRFVDFLDFDTRHDGNRLPAVPIWQVANRLVWHIHTRWHFAVQYRFTDRMPLNDANTGFNDSFQVVDINTHYQLYYRKKSIHLHAGINNVFNTKYASSILPNAIAFGNAQPRYFYPGLPFQWYFGVKIQLPN